MNTTCEIHQVMIILNAVQKSKSIQTAQSNAVCSTDLQLERKILQSITHHDCIFLLLLVYPCVACVSSF